MANEQNLTAPPIQSTEEARRKGHAGGIASGKARREKRRLRDMLRAELYSKAPGTDMTKAEVITARVIKALADNPNIRDLRTAYELLGELEQNINVAGSVDMARPVIVFKDARKKADSEE